MERARAAARFFLVGVAVLGAASLAPAQDVGAPPAGAVVLNPSDLEQLVAPVALYPDPLLAEVLPAATYPSDIQSAASFLQANPSPTPDAINAQPFDPSVKALLYYPSVLNMMASQLDWTTQLGIAFINQQSDVMAAVQTLRQRAAASGALVSGPQQQVVSDENGIEIYPTDDNTLYVPNYDADALYVGNGSGFYITFGVGYSCGAWLGNSFDWHDHWLGSGGGWDHGWHRPTAGHPFVPPQRWQRDAARPMPVLRAGARPGYDAGRAAPGAFDYGRPGDVQRDDERAQERAAPPPRAAPPAPPRAEQRDAPPPREAPAPPPREAPAFNDQGGRDSGADSARGHASMGGGGGGGGGHAGGGGGRR